MWQWKRTLQRFILLITLNQIGLYYHMNRSKVSKLWVVYVWFLAVAASLLGRDYGHIPPFVRRGRQDRNPWLGKMLLELYCWYLDYNQVNHNVSRVFIIYVKQTSVIGCPKLKFWHCKCSQLLFYLVKKDIRRNDTFFYQPITCNWFNAQTT